MYTYIYTLIMYGMGKYIYIYVYIYGPFVNGYGSRSPHKMAKRRSSRRPPATSPRRLPRPGKVPVMIFFPNGGVSNTNGDVMNKQIYIYIYMYIHMYIGYMSIICIIMYTIVYISFMSIVYSCGVYNF